MVTQRETETNTDTEQINHIVMIRNPISKKKKFKSLH
jgi:hypothetical protein